MATQVRGSQARRPAKTGGPAKPERTSPPVFVREVRAEVGIVTGVDTVLTRLVFAVFSK